MEAAILSRHGPLVRRALGRFCGSSRCEHGLCRPYDLVSMAFIIFRRSLEEYDASEGLDFPGYLSIQLRWGLLHTVEAARRVELREIGAPETLESAGATTVDTTVRRLVVDELLGMISKRDADLLARRYLADEPIEVLASHYECSAAALRKRLQRARTRLRAAMG